MIQKEQSVVQLCYGIPYRRQRGNLEFCLFVFPDQRDWDFPQAVEPTDEGQRTRALLAPCQAAGFSGRVDETPLGQFEASRGETVEIVTAFLVEVTSSDDKIDDSGSPRRRWCLTEEAKVRIRRKPLRHLLERSRSAAFRSVVEHR